MSESFYSARVLIRLQSDVNDPQGLTVLGSLRDIGHEEVRGVRVGKIIELTLIAPRAITPENKIHPNAVLRSSFIEICLAK